jgi:hypothetical protein
MLFSKRFLAAGGHLSNPQKKFENDFYFGYNLELRIEIGGKSAAKRV